jgi:hypothetical protein
MTRIERIGADLFGFIRKEVEFTARLTMNAGPGSIAARRPGNRI